MSTEHELGIGVLGCSYIAPFSVIKPAAGIDGMRVIGVAGRDPRRSRSYAEAHGIPRIFPDYEQLLAAGDIDLVYIALPPVFQGKWAKRALEAGKHVLIEKPMCLDVETAEGVAAAARSSGRHVLEAVMVQHHSWQERIRDMIQTREHGELHRIETRICSEFGELAPENFRRFPETGGGVLHDEAPYWLQFVQRVIGFGHRSAIEAHSSFSGPHGLDWIVEANLRFDDGVQANAFLSYDHPREASHVIFFDNATVEIKNFFRPAFGSYKLHIEALLRDGSRRKETFHPQNYYANQLEFFRDVIRGARENLPIESSIARITASRALYEAMRAIDDIHSATEFNKLHPRRASGHE